MPEITKIIPLYVSYAGETGIFYFSFQTSEVWNNQFQVFLKDKVLQTITPINGQTAVPFEVNYSLAATDRFELIVAPTVNRSANDHISPAVRVFPNPVVSSTTIVFPPEEGLLAFEILDEPGRMIHKSMHSGKGGFAILDISNLPSGSYRLRITGKAGPQMVRLVKL
jgi:hypothetical protein